MSRPATLPLLASLALAGCSGEVHSNQSPPSVTTNSDGGVSTMLPGTPDLATGADDPTLTARQVNYGRALRTASLKLVGDLPTLAEQVAIVRANDPRVAYAQQIEAYLADPRFAGQLIAFHRNAFKMGGAADMTHPSRETAPTFAAMVAIQDRPYTDIFTASSSTCPTFDAKSGQFSGGECKSGSPVTAGVLTDPGVQSQFYSNMAFRRVRWLQETFACRKFPAEYTRMPVPMGAGQYTSPWPFDSITGGDGAPVNFHDTSAVICANCHTSMNHLAPLFANYDAMGKWQMSIQVTTPVNGLPKTKLTDWLPSGESTSWRFGQQVSDLGALGQSLARDPDVASCTAARVWNWAMSKGDVVTDLATVPEPVIAPIRSAYVAGNYSLKQTIRTAFTSDDFVKF